MELSSPSRTLTSNGCAATDYSIPVKEEKTDIFLQNNASSLTSDPDSLANSKNCEPKSLDMVTKEIAVGNCNNQASSGKKRKICEDEMGHGNSMYTTKVGKLDTSNKIKEKVQNDSEENIEKVSQSKKPRNRRTLWIMSCDRCSFETDNMDEFSCHINILHSNLNDFKCHKCSFTTVSSALLKKHERYVNPAGLYFRGRISML